VPAYLKICFFKTIWIEEIGLFANSLSQYHYQSHSPKHPIRQLFFLQIIQFFQNLDRISQSFFLVHLDIALSCRDCNGIFAWNTFNNMDIMKIIYNLIGVLIWMVALLICGIVILLAYPIRLFSTKK